MRNFSRLSVIAPAALLATLTLAVSLTSGHDSASQAEAGGGPFAYITNGGSDNVSVIDTATNTVTATVPVGELPVGVAVHPAGTRVYVANAVSFSVSVIDTGTNTVTATVLVGDLPVAVAVNPAGTRVYVTNALIHNVSVIDTGTNTVTATVPVGFNPQGVAVNPAGTRVYVTNIFSDNVSVIDTATNTVTATVPVGGDPLGVAVNPAGIRVYVANNISDNVSVIDATTNTVIATVPVGDLPAGVAVNPAGTRVYVTNNGSDNVSVIDTATNTVTATVPVGNGPAGVAVNPAGTRVYVANFTSNDVSVIDTATNTVMATVPVGTAPQAWGQFISPSTVPPPPPPPPAVLLLHGWRGSCSGMQSLENYLESNGYAGRVDCFDYDATEGVRKVAGDLATEVEIFKSSLPNPPDRVHIVAHSFGGLASRYFIEDAELNGASQVASLTMLGTPNLGVRLARVVYLLGASVFDRAAWDMRPESKVLDELNDAFGAPSTQYRVVAGTAGGLLGRILYGSATNDCIVSLQSAKGPGGAFDTTPRGVIHTGALPSWLCTNTSNLLDSTVVFADVLAAIQGASASSSSSPAQTQALLPPTPDIAAQAGSTVGVISQGQVATQLVNVDSTSEAVFSIFWLSADTTVPTLRLTLQTPSGTVMDASGTGVTYNSMAGPLFGGMMAESYVVDTPETGQWILRVEGVDVPPEGLSYIVMTTVDSSIAISASLDQASYLVDDPVLAAVAVADAAVPITDATVSAQVSTPGGSVALNLHDDGLNGDKAASDGVYSAILGGTASCGIYTFEFTAVGQAVAFTRQASIVTDVHVSGDLAGDPCTGDDDADGCTDQQELGGNESLGGRRDPLYFWDFFDPNLDRAVAFADFLLVLQHFNTNDNGGAAAINRNTDPLSPAAETAAGVYSPRYDRGGQAPGGDPWDELPPDGSIAFGDFLSLLRQFGHSCA